MLLEAFSFTHPTTVEDLGMLRDRIKNMPWSMVPSVDATLRGNEVSLELRIGAAMLKRTWPIV